MTEYELNIIRFMIFFHKIIVAVILIATFNYIDVSDDEIIDLKVH